MQIHLNAIASKDTKDDNFFFIGDSSCQREN